MPWRKRRSTSATANASSEIGEALLHVDRNLNEGGINANKKESQEVGFKKKTTTKSASKRPSSSKKSAAKKGSAKKRTTKASTGILKKAKKALKAVFVGAAAGAAKGAVAGAAEAGSKATGIGGGDDEKNDGGKTSTRK
jgi:hypothetical protein